LTIYTKGAFLITLKLKNKPAVSFNLRNFEREQDLCSVVRYNTAAEIKLRTTFGDQLEFKVKDVEACQFFESEYVRGVVHTGPHQEPVDDTADRVMNILDKRKRKRMKTFMNHLDPATRRKVDDILSRGG
jgi:hypothetical protein